MSLFIAIPIPPEIQQVLPKFKAKPGIHPVTDENRHITLKFLGKVPEIEIENICHHLRQISFTPFQLTLGNFGTFDHHHRQIFWAGVEPSAQLEATAHAVKQLFVPDEQDKPFIPHITLARFSRLQWKLFNPSDLQLPDERWAVDHFALYQSYPNAVYKIRETF